MFRKVCNWARKCPRANWYYHRQSKVVFFDQFDGRLSFTLFTYSVPYMNVCFMGKKKMLMLLTSSSSPVLRLSLLSPPPPPTPPAPSASLTPYRTLHVWFRNYSQCGFRFKKYSWLLISCFLWFFVWIDKHRKVLRRIEVLSIYHITHVALWLHFGYINERSLNKRIKADKRTMKIYKTD